LTRNNEAIIVLPHSLLKELSVLPTSTASPQVALHQDLTGHYTGVSQILESNLHFTILQRKLTPRIPLLVPRMQQTVIDAFARHFPDAKEWTEIQPTHIMGPISAKIAADGLVGPEFRDDPTWLEISTHFTEAGEAPSTPIPLISNLHLRYPISCHTHTPT
jgi:ent-kaurene oxidase